MNREQDRDASLDRLLRRTLRAGGTAAAGGCLDPESFAAWADGTLGGGALQSAEAHVAGCARCQMILASLTRLETLEPPAIDQAAETVTDALVQPPRQPAPSWWRAPTLRWLVPLTGLATAVAIWVAVPRTGTPQRAERVTEADSVSAGTPPFAGPAQERQSPEPAAAGAIQPAAPAPRSPARSESASQVPAVPLVEPPAGGASSRLAAEAIGAVTPRPPAPTADGATAAKAQAAAEVPAAPSTPSVSQAAASRSAAQTAASSATASAPSVVPSAAASSAAEPIVPLPRSVDRADTSAPPPPNAGDAATVTGDAAFRTQTGAPANGANTAAGGGSGRAGGVVGGVAAGIVGGLAGAGGRGGRAGDGAIVSTPDAQVRWRVSAAAAERSTDGGRTWQRLAFSGNPELLRNIVTGSCPTPDVCWFAGRTGTVLVAADGRTVRAIEFPDVSNLTAVAAVNGLEAIVTASDGRRFRTDDGGRTWQPAGLR